MTSSRAVSRVRSSLVKRPLALLSALWLSACSIIRPDGVVDNVVDGNFFGDKPTPPPTDLNHIRPPEGRAPVRWRIDF